MNQVVSIPITSIRPDPNQPREEKPADAIKEMSNAFLETGFDAHITVRPDPESPVPFQGDANQDMVDAFIGAGGLFMIIKGECRYTSFVLNPELLEKYNGDITSFVDLRERSEKDIFLDQIQENVNRIQMSPMNTARSYGHAIEVGASLDEVARTFGKQPSFIQSELDLLKLPRYIQNEIDAGKLPKTVAHEIAKEPDDARRGKAYKQAMKGKGAKDQLIKLQAWRDQDAQKTLDSVFGTQDAAPDELKKLRKSFDKMFQAVTVFSNNAGDKGGLVVKAMSKNTAKVNMLADEMIKQANMMKANIKLHAAYTGVKEESKKVA